MWFHSALQPPGEPIPQNEGNLRAATKKNAQPKLGALPNFRATSSTESAEPADI
jgi:hypothetical protein